MHARQPMLHISSIPKRSEDAVACSIIRLHPLKPPHFVSSSQNCGKPDPEPIIVFSSRRCRKHYQFIYLTYAPTFIAPAIDVI